MRLKRACLLAVQQPTDDYYIFFAFIFGRIISTEKHLHIVYLIHSMFFKWFLSTFKNSTVAWSYWSVEHLFGVERVEMPAQNAWMHNSDDLANDRTLIDTIISRNQIQKSRITWKLLVSLYWVHVNRRYANCLNAFYRIRHVTKY